MISNAGYDAVMVVHALFAFVGFGAIGATGAYARLARLSPHPFANGALRRYFRAGRNLAGRSIFVVPILGGLLLVLQHGDDASVPYPWIGLSIWVVAAGLATAVIWPGEKVVQRLFREPNDSPQSGDVDDLRAVARRIEMASAITSLLFVLAMVDMVIQPF